MQPFAYLTAIGKTDFTHHHDDVVHAGVALRIIKFVDQLKSGQGNLRRASVQVFLLSVPKDIQIFFPMAALLARCWAGDAGAA